MAQAFFALGGNMGDARATLERGYAIVRRGDAAGAVVTDAAVLRPGDAVALVFARSRARARVEDTEG